LQAARQKLPHNCRAVYSSAGLSAGLTMVQVVHLIEPGPLAELGGLIISQAEGADKKGF